MVESTQALPEAVKVIKKETGPVEGSRPVPVKREPAPAAKKADVVVEKSTPAAVEKKEFKQELHPAFQRQFYRFRKKFLQIFGGSYDVYDENDEKILFGVQKPLRLREDFRVYPNNQRKDKEELLRLKTPHIIDWWATYHVTDSQTGEAVGAVKRLWGKSIFKDTWKFLDPKGEEIGTLTEKTKWGAFLSRIFTMPQEYIIKDPSGKVNARINQHYNIFVPKYDMHVSPEPTIDRRLLVAAGLLLTGIEGLQSYPRAGFSHSTSSS